jgi:hypothetical protein
LSAEGYRVVQEKHGIAIFGPVGVEDLAALAKQWKRRGYDTIATGVAAALGASFCVTSRDGARAWQDEIEAGVAQRSDGNAELDWLLGCDTGTSSMTILSVLGSSPAATRGAATKLGERGGDAPYDPDDLGRCIRLLDIFPAWRARLGEVADAFPVWRPIAEAWTELEALYREEVPEHRGSAPRLYKRMCELRGRA